MSIGDRFKTFIATNCPDEVQIDTAIAPVDPSLAASRAATASLSALVSVTEHATPTPVDMCTAPARMIEHVAPAPVIEYIAPSPAVSYPLFFPSFDQINEAVTDLEKPQFSITADETSQMPVVERIQEQSAVSDLVTSVESSPVVNSVPLLHAMEYIMPEPGPAELSALESLQSVIHQKQMKVDRGVVVLKSEKNKLRLFEECSFAPPRDLEELRRAIQAGQDALAVAMRDVHAFREQFGLRQEASAERAAAELLREEEVAAPKTKKANKGKR